MAAAKKVDSKGRLLLGEELAGTTVLIEKLETGEYLVKPAVIVPAKEKWIFDNSEALSLVMTGLKEAKNRKFVKNPSFNKKKSWIDELEDDFDV